MEGPQAVRECATTCETIFVTSPAAGRWAGIVNTARSAGVEVLLVDDTAPLSDSVTPQGIVGIHRTVDVGLSSLLGIRSSSEVETGQERGSSSERSERVETPRLVVIAAQVRDPGNAGTVIRCADAFGADAVILTSGSVDLHNPKTVRASVGSIFHLPIVTGLDLTAAVEACHAAGMTVLAADGTGEHDLDQLRDAGELAAPVAWLFGNEAWGLPEADRALADRAVRVPMWGSAESLNLSTAAAVCLYATGSAQRSSAQMSTLSDRQPGYDAGPA